MNQVVSRLLGGAAVAGALAGLTLAGAAPVLAQSAPVVSRPVVQALPGADSKKLSAALARIARDPRDITALVDAGDAARGLQDYEAAIGFYRRVEEISPGNALAKAGLGSALVHSGDPVSAIPAFDAADKAGATAALIAGDRGLAYDLVGDNAAAQRAYALALGTVSGAAADELRMRLSVSQAIAGNGDAAYATLLPLLNRQDKPGWRTRAFTLAIAGDTEEAVSVAGKILPGPLAQNIAPYLRYMPRLTKAQQAAAANLGRFPRASEIGRDDARIAAYAPPRANAAGGALIPRGEPLGSGAPAKLAVRTTAKAARPRTTRPDSRLPSRHDTSIPAVRATGRATARPVTVAAVDPDRVAPPDPKPTIERDSGELPPLNPASGASAAPAPKAAATPAPPASTPTPPPVSTPPRASAPGFDLARLPATPAPAPAAAPVPAAAAPAASAPPPPASAAPAPGPDQRSLSDIFADIGKPTRDALPASGAVDIRQITPAAPRVQPPRVEEVKAVEVPEPAPDARAKAKDGKGAAAKATDTKAPDAKATSAKTKAAEAKARKPAPPSHPSRIWVQIGVGRDKGAIAFDWRRYTRENAALLKGRQPYITEMGRTNRILIGPFATQKAAAAFLADAKKQGFPDALPWTSPAGQVVDPLAAK